jgi:predicted flavoprotein YhiN
MNYLFKVPLNKMEGEILKNVVTSIGDFQKAGEVTLTNYGFEGAAIYHLNRSFRENPNLPLCIDLKPQWNDAQVLACLKSVKNNTEGLKKMKLSKAAIFLLKSETEKETFLNPESLALKIKNLSLKIESLRPMDEAISTSGGVSWKELNSDLSLKKFPNIQLCGEMLDWDAPTGGYLLQASIASGFCAGAV